MEPVFPAVKCKPPGKDCPLRSAAAQSCLGHGPRVSRKVLRVRCLAWAALGLPLHFSSADRELCSHLVSRRGWGMGRLSSVPSDPSQGLGCALWPGDMVLPGGSFPSTTSALQTRSLALGSGFSLSCGCPLKSGRGHGWGEREPSLWILTPLRVTGYEHNSLCE